MKHHPDCDVYQATMDKQANEAYGLNLEIDPDRYTCYCEDEVKVRQVSGTITLSNGETVEFLIGPDSDHRWGNTRENLAHAVLPCETMSTALWVEGHYETDGGCLMLNPTTETYFKATRPDGTSFHDGTTRWEVGKVTHLPDGSKLPYLSVSVVATNCAGFEWPCRLFRVEPVEGHEVTTPGPRHMPNKRGSSAWRVVEELDARLALGPNADEVLAIIERARTLTDDEVRKMDTPWDDTWYAARDAAEDAARDASRYAARYATWDAAEDAVIRYSNWSATWDAARNAAVAALATLVQDLITQEQYETLMGPWWAGVGR